VIRTVTFSTGFDHLVHVDSITPGGVGHVLSWVTQASGKGIGVARTVVALGEPCVAYCLVGEVGCDRFMAGVESDGVDVRVFTAPGRVRDNLTLTNDSMSDLAGHAVGARLSSVPSDVVDALVDALVSETQPGDIVTFNGGLVGGQPTHTWARIAERVHTAGATVIADIQGEALVSAVATGKVTAAKPNEEEVRALPGVSSVDDPIEAGVSGVRTLYGFGVTNPMVTLGSQGVVHIADGDIHLSTCPVSNPKLVVGAGDAFLAGFCVGLGGTDPVRYALAVAAAHVSGLDISRTDVVPFLDAIRTTPLAHM